MLTVILKHSPNPDVDSGYWSKMSRPCDSVEVLDFSEASRVCREYINKYELGGGNWTGGKVVNKNGNQIARVSYNGRVWAMDGSEIKHLG